MVVASTSRKPSLRTKIATRLKEEMVVVGLSCLAQTAVAVVVDSMVTNL